ncbi:MAG: hypothetical protein CMJ18_05135 [Phycisphaeraceae bacterium]|nr:hypothetical protein [Phycisphaeraceae bacterium]
MLITLSLAAGCADTPPPHRGEIRGAPGTSETAAPIRAARAFVDAVNALDAERASGLIDWERWVANDVRLKVLVRELRHRYAKSPPGPKKLASHPIEGSDVTLQQILDSADPGALLARVSRQRFAATMVEDFSHENRKMPARLVTWNLDRIDQSATLFMPNGERVEMKLVNRNQRWWLLPRWYP